MDVIPLTSQCLRALTDKQYEKRKWAAGEIEKTVKKAKLSNEFEDIKAIIKTLSDLATSTNPNSRKGGVIGLASVAVALGPDLEEEYIEQTIRPMFASLDDQDSQVRYYACEALYNILKLANTNCLNLFDDIFDKMAKLSADPDIENRNALEALDKTLKNIIEMADKSFDVSIVIKSIRDRSLVRNYQTQQFLLSWIIFLKNKMLQIDLLPYLHYIIDGILHILSESNEETLKQCEDVLEYYLRKIKQTPNQVDISKMINPIILYTSSSYNDIVRYKALAWLHELLIINPLSFIPFISGLLAAILPCLSSSKNDLSLNDGFVVNSSSKLSKASFMPTYDLQAVADLINEKIKNLVTDQQKKEFSESKNTDDSVIDKSIDIIDKKTNQKSFELSNIMDVLINSFKNKNPKIKIAVLKWILHLDNEIPEKVCLYKKEIILNNLIELLNEESENEVIDLDLQVISKILTSPLISRNEPSDDLPVFKSITNKTCFDEFIKKFINFLADKNYLEERGFSILRQLCKYVEPQDVYYSLSYFLLKSNLSLENKDKIIKALNKILLTSCELYKLRLILRDEEKNKKELIFKHLYKTWCLSPIASLALCYLSKEYKLAYRILMIFSQKSDINLTILQEIDKLIQLIESPVFAYLRMDLLDKKNVYLKKSLYGLLMLLPQTKAFNLLKERLQCASNLNLDDSTDDLNCSIEEKNIFNWYVHVFEQAIETCSINKSN